MTRKKTEIPLYVKKDICTEKKRAKQHTLASLKTFILNKYSLDIGISTISEILTQNDKWFTRDTREINTRITSPRFQKVEDALIIWISQMNSANISLCTEVIISKAKQFAEKLKIDEFAGSVGWFNRFKNRFGLKRIKLHGESNNIPEDMVEKGLCSIKEKLNNVELDCIFNFDETALFYNLMPNSTFAKGIIKGIKQSKSRITIGVCANVTGTIKIQPWVIGHSKNPRCFKDFDIERYVTYRANTKAWMTSVIFLEFLHFFNTEMIKKGIHAKLLVDNAPSHNIDKKFSHVELIYLPPNMTSRLQPMDAGIIRSMKCRYRTLLLLKLVGLNEEDSPIGINLRDAIIFIHMAWNYVSCKTIYNCFVSTGLFQLENANMIEKSCIFGNDEMNNDELIFCNATDSKDLIKNINELEREIETETVMTDIEIIELTEKNISDTEGNLDKNNEIMPVVSRKDVIKSLETIMLYISHANSIPSFKDNTFEKVIFKKLEDIKCYEHQSNLKQTSLFDLGFIKKK